MIKGWTSASLAFYRGIYTWRHLWLFWVPRSAQSCSLSLLESIKWFTSWIHFLNGLPRFCILLGIHIQIFFGKCCSSILWRCLYQIIILCLLCIRFLIFHILLDSLVLKILQPEYFITSAQKVHFQGVWSIAVYFIIQQNWIYFATFPSTIHEIIPSYFYWLLHFTVSVLR